MDRRKKQNCSRLIGKMHRDSCGKNSCYRGNCMVSCNQSSNLFEDVGTGNFGSKVGADGWPERIEKQTGSKSVTDWFENSLEPRAD